mgnify:CR=1 FL=1
MSYIFLLFPDFHHLKCSLFLRFECDFFLFYIDRRLFDVSHLSCTEILECLYDLFAGIHDEGSMLDATLVEWGTAHHEESGTRHSCDFESISRLREGDHITIFEHFLVHCRSSCDDEDKCIISFWCYERN